MSLGQDFFKEDCIGIAFGPSAHGSLDNQWCITILGYLPPRIPMEGLFATGFVRGRLGQGTCNYASEPAFTDLTFLGRSLARGMISVGLNCKKPQILYPKGAEALGWSYSQAITVLMTEM